MIEKLPNRFVQIPNERELWQKINEVIDAVNFMITPLDDPLLRKAAPQPLQEAVPELSGCEELAAYRTLMRQRLLCIEGQYVWGEKGEYTHTYRQLTPEDLAAAHREYGTGG